MNNREKNIRTGELLMLIGVIVAVIVFVLSLYPESWAIIFLPVPIVIFLLGLLIYFANWFVERRAVREKLRKY